MAVRALVALTAASMTTAQHHLTAGLLSMFIDARSGGYNVTLRDTVAGGAFLFTSTPLLILYNGSYLSSGDGSLVCTGGGNATAGADGMGAFTRVALACRAWSPSLKTLAATPRSRRSGTFVFASV